MTVTQAILHRQLDTSERFFWLLDRVSGMNFVVFAEIRGKLDVSRLQDTLQQAQQVHPLLRVRIVSTAEGELWFEPALDAIPFLQVAVNRENWQHYIEAELSVEFPLGRGPLLRCHYLEFPDRLRAVLALTFHHTIADGRSGVALLREVLHHACQSPPVPYPATGQVHPPMHAVFPEQYQWNRHPEAALALHETRKAELRRHGRPATFPWLDSSQSTRLPRFERVVLDAGQMNSLISQCRENNATIHGAIGAAQLLALYQAAEQEEPQTLSLGSPADMRPYLATPLPITGLGLYVTLLASSYRISNASDFWELARHVTLDIKRQLQRGDGHLQFAYLQPEKFPPTAQGIADFAELMLASPHSSMISNIGVVEPVAAHVGVESVSFALCPMPYQILFNAVSSYNGQLFINLAYDAAKLQPQQARQLTQSIQQALLKQATA